MHKLCYLILFILSIAVAGFAGPGDLDTTFAGTGKARLGFKSGDDQANAAITQSDGKLIVVGTTPNGDRGDFYIVRYNPNGSLDQTFGSGGRVFTHFGRGYDAAMSVALQADGKIVAAGVCDGANPDPCVARYNTDGSLDSTFGTGGKVITPITNSTDQAHGVAIQGDGKIVVVGSTFTDFATSDFLVMRYNANGSLDSTFGPQDNGIIIRDISPNQTDTANAVTIQPDGKIVAVGYGVASQSPNFIIITRFTTEGDPDNSFTFNGLGMYRFTAAGDYRANAVTIQPDGKILLAGVGDSKFILVRFIDNGTFDNSFNGNGRVVTSVGGSIDEARAVMVSGSTPRITVAGFSSGIMGGDNKRFAIARFAMNGEPDGSFGGTGKVITPIGGGDNDQINAVALNNGAIAVAGSVENFNHDFAVARYTAAGILDETFDTDGKQIDDPGTRNASARSIAVQPDGKIVVAGWTDTDLQGLNFAMARYNPNGSLDMNFADNGRWTTEFGSENERCYAVAIAPDGKIILAGARLDPSANTYDFVLARYDNRGIPDPTFNGNGKLVLPVGPSNDFAYGVAVQPDGKIVVVGSTEVTGGTDYAVVRLKADGTPDGTFGNGGKEITPVGPGTDEARAVRIQADGKIVVSGNSYTGTNSDFSIVRYTTGGTPDNSFGSLGKQITPVGAHMDISNGMVLQPDGKAIVAGYSTGAPGTRARMALVRYGTNGLPDNSFDTDGIVTTPVGLVEGLGTAVAVQPDGKIVMSGAAGVNFKIDYVSARYMSNGSLDSSYGASGVSVIDVTGEDDIAWAMAVDGSGRSVIAGDAKGLFGVIRLAGDIAPRKTPFDFDADGKTDAAIFRPSNAEWWVLRSGDGGNNAAQFGATTDRIAPADFTGDGKTDFAFFRPSTGQWFVLRSEDSSFYAFPFGTNGDVPVPADYDGDGKADAAVFRPSSATWFIQRSGDNGTTINQFGIAGDIPVPADYDGDGKADIAIRRPGNGQWWLSRSSAGIIAFTFGDSVDKAVPGDYTGDGKADVAVWRPSMGSWFVLRSEDNSFFAFPFGTSGDIPAPGDYDGDGRMDAGVFRPAGATWFINKSSGGVSTIPFGAAGDRPVPNAFVQ